MRWFDNEENSYIQAPTFNVYEKCGITNKNKRTRARKKSTIARYLITRDNAVLNNIADI